jgi:serine protease Do
MMDDRLALEVAELTDAQREKYSLKKGGVFIVNVEQGAAGKAGIRRGDVIVSIDNEQIKSAKQFLDIARDLPEDKAIPVLVQRQQDAIFLALRIEKE